MIRTVEQYLESLRDGRVLYCLGERVKDVTKHPVLRKMVKRWINTCRTRYRNLLRLDVNDYQARIVAASRRGPWGMSNMKLLKAAISNRFLTQQWFSSLFDQYRALGKAT